MFYYRRWPQESNLYANDLLNQSSFWADDEEALRYVASTNEPLLTVRRRARAQQRTSPCHRKRRAGVGDVLLKRRLDDILALSRQRLNTVR